MSVRKYSIHRLEMMLADLRAKRESMSERKRSNAGDWLFLAGLIVAIFVHWVVGVILCIVGAVIHFSTKGSQASHDDILKLDAKIYALKEAIIKMKEDNLEYLDRLPSAFDTPRVEIKVISEEENQKNKVVLAILIGTVIFVVLVSTLLVR